MRKLIKTAGLAVVLSAMAVSSANATTGRAMFTTTGSMDKVASNLSSHSGNATSYAAHTFQAGGATVSCATAKFTITAVSTTTTHFDPIYQSCQLLVSGTPVAAASVTTPCTWTLSIQNATYNDATGAGTGATVRTNCVSVVHAPAVNCEIDVAAQTAEGISTQSIDASGANTAAATPWGSKIVAAATGLSYTVPAGKSCPGVTSPGTNGAYTGTVAAKDVFGML